MSLADQIAADLDRLVAADDHAIAATYLPQGASAGSFACQVIPHPAEDGLIEQDGETFALQSRSQRFTILASGLTALTRAPMQGDVLTIASGTHAGTWTVTAPADHLYMHAVQCVRRRVAGVGHGDARRVVR